MIFQILKQGIEGSYWPQNYAMQVTSEKLRIRKQWHGEGRQREKWTGISTSITGTQVAVCKIDTSKMPAGVGNNEIPGITRYNNFSFDEDGMQVSRKYSRHTVLAKVWRLNTDSKQEDSGLEIAREWSQAVTRKQQKRNKRESKACNSDLVNTYASLAPSSILTFSTLDDADEHMQWILECHVMLLENECVYDTIRRQWAATATSVKGKSQKISDSQYHPESTVQQEACQGWALRKQKATGRISPSVKECLT